MKTCFVIGHREFSPNEELKEYLEKLFEDLIKKHFVDTFYFGRKGYFDDYCYKIVTKKMKKYTHITRVYIADDYRDYDRFDRRCKLQEFYEDIEYFPLKYDYWYKRLYFRNIATIDNSDFVIFYTHIDPNSGSYKAFKYAKSKNFLFDKEITESPQVIVAERNLLTQK